MSVGSSAARSANSSCADLGGGVDDRGVLGPVGETGAREARLRAPAARSGWVAGCRCRRGGTDAARRAPRRTRANHRRVRSTPSAATSAASRRRSASAEPMSPLRWLADEVVVAVDAEQRHRAVIEQRRRAAGIERLERRLRIGLERDQASEHVVGEVDHGSRRSEVRRQRARCRRRPDRPRAGTGRCRHAGTGRSTAWGRRR